MKTSVARGYAVRLYLRQVSEIERLKNNANLMSSLECLVFSAFTGSAESSYLSREWEGWWGSTWRVERRWPSSSLPAWPPSTETLSDLTPATSSCLFIQIGRPFQIDWGRTALSLLHNSVLTAICSHCRSSPKGSLLYLWITAIWQLWGIKVISNIRVILVIFWYSSAT